jgi:hypothetical protein
MELNPIEIALLIIEKSNLPGMRHTHYIVARADVDLMHDAVYLQSVLGSEPHYHAIEFGIENKIQDFKNQWLKIGIEPAKIHLSDAII